MVFSLARIKNKTQVFPKIGINKMEMIHIHKHYKNVVVRFVNGYDAFVLYSEDYHFQQGDFRKSLPINDFHAMSARSFFGGNLDLSAAQKIMIKKINKV